MDDWFDPYELELLRVAEEECPWGEMAQNYRMLYLASMQAAGGEEVDAMRQRLWLKLFGRQPESPPPKAGDFARQ